MKFPFRTADVDTRAFGNLVNQGGGSIRTTRLSPGPVSGNAHQGSLPSVLLNQSIMLVNGDGGSLFWMDEASEELHQVCARACDEFRDLVLKARDQVVARRSIVITPCPPRAPLVQNLDGLGARHAIGAPLLQHKQLRGILVIVRRGGVPFTRNDGKSLGRITEFGAVALAEVEQARLDGVSLAVRTVQHELRNKLALTAGYAELLGLDPEMPPHLCAVAAKASDGVMAAGGVLDALERVRELRLIDWGNPINPTIDLDASS